MKEIKFTGINVEGFHSAFMACMIAFGCMTLEEEQNSITITSFNDGDDEIIIDTMKEVGCRVAYCRPPQID